MSTQQSIQAKVPESAASTSRASSAMDKIGPISISRIIEQIRARAEGGPSSDETWIRFTLDTKHYRDLMRQLQDSSVRGYFEDKIKYNFFPLSNLFVLRGWSPVLYEGFQAAVGKEIVSQLTAIAQSQSPSAKFAEKVHGWGSAQLDFSEDEYGSHSPGSSFGHYDCQYPGVIVEVSYPQKRRDLPQLAEAYILGSSANIRAVIGIDIQSEKGKQASISVWRPQIIRNDAGEAELWAVQIVTDQLFRNNAGDLITHPEANLKLCVGDFGSRALAARFKDLSEPVCISHEALFVGLGIFEKMQDMNDRGEGMVDSEIHWDVIRRRERTPKATS